MIVGLAAAVIFQSLNTLTSTEIKEGWKLLFDGTSTKGWHSYKGKGVRSGWVVKDGVLTSADTRNAGDIVTDETFDWFDLQLDLNVGKGQNSGIMFRVIEQGEAPWHSGPEIQIYDHAFEPGVQITGHLYELYAPTFDASKPSGEWNHMRIVVSPKKCFTELNGVKYYEYDLGSAEFWERVKKSKFSKFPEFAIATKGSIGIQGDHGVVSFRNIKIKRLSNHKADWYDPWSNF
jgi:hypothetical protein